MIQLFSLLEEFELKNKVAIFSLIKRQYSLTDIVVYNYFDCFHENFLFDFICLLSNFVQKTIRFDLYNNVFEEDFEYF